MSILTVNCQSPLGIWSCAFDLLIRFYRILSLFFAVELFAILLHHISYKAWHPVVHASCIMKGARLLNSNSTISKGCNPSRSERASDQCIHVIDSIKSVHSLPYRSYRAGGWELKRTADKRCFRCYAGWRNCSSTKQITLTAFHTWEIYHTRKETLPPLLSVNFYSVYP